MSEQVTYRRAKTWHIALSQMTGIMQMMFYVLTIGYAIYIANLGFGVTIALAGVLATVSRVFDSVTDPIIAVIIEKFNSKYGKLRFFLIVGWFLMSLSTLLLCNLLGGKFSFGADQTTSNVTGVIVFTLLFFLFYIGYTFASCIGNMTGNILTNDPKQRPTLGVWSTVYSYLSPMIGAAIITTMLLPKYGVATVTALGATDYDWTMAVFSHASFIMIGISFVALILCCIGLTPYDKPENFVGLNKNNTPFLKGNDLAAQG